MTSIENQMSGTTPSGLKTQIASKVPNTDMTALKEEINDYQNFVVWGEELNFPSGSDAQLTWIRRFGWDDDEYNYHTIKTVVPVGPDGKIVCDD